MLRPALLLIVILQLHLLYSFLIYILLIGYNLAIRDLDDPVCHSGDVQVVCNNHDRCLISIIHFLYTLQYIL